MMEYAPCLRVLIREEHTNMQIFTRTRHIHEDALGLHALNDLPESRQSLVTEHLSACVRCRVHFHEVQEFVNILKLAARA
jgi:predicted anti-sigma-YlaC factor YlaD